MHVVTGAGGFIGSHLVDALLDRDLPVAACVLPEGDLRWLDGKPVEIRRIDVTDPPSLGPALRDAEVVYHLAGATRTASDETFFDVNCVGTVNVARAARLHASGLRRFLFVSSTSAIGPTRNGRPVCEEDDPRPVSAYGRSKALAEERLREMRDLPWLIVRPAAVYGPRDLSFLTLFRLGHQRIFPYVGRGYRKTSFAHVDDIVAGILLAVERGTPHRAYHLTGEADDYHGVFRALCDALGHAIVPVPLPASIVWAVGELMELRYRLTGINNVINRRKAMEMLQPGWTASCERAIAEIGFRARYTVGRGFSDTASWYHDQGWLSDPYRALLGLWPSQWCAIGSGTPSESHPARPSSTGMP
ncbi:MAG: NAD-dependent epimerase/dehydratase family protein [Deltaproteobacteria bacterium]|nr:NAD-dependent epimerase/dehydratase family protein [Deltaproteobacteria bacterium]